MKPIALCLIASSLAATGELILPADADPRQAAIARHWTQLFDLLTPRGEDDGWRQLGWETDLWKARQRAAEEGKPIFLWEMDGHPLGCT